MPGCQAVTLLSALAVRKWAKWCSMQGDTQITESSNLASDKQQNMIRAVCKSMGKVPPANLQAMTKREASAYIDTLKAGEQPAPQYDTPEEPF
jgi:hypothetical protein